MGKRKRSGKADRLTSTVNLTAAILNLIATLILLYEKLSG